MEFFAFDKATASAIFPVNQFISQYFFGFDFNLQTFKEDLL